MWGALVRDERGTAMTQGVIVIPFFIIIWMGLMALFQLYGARLEAQVAAGAAAMAMADGGDCGDADLSIDSISQTSGMDTGLEQEEADRLESIAGCQPFAWSHAEATVSSEVEDLPEAMGGPSQEVSGSRVLMCNMKPVDGLMDLVAQVVMEALGIDDEE